MAEKPTTQFASPDASDLVIARLRRTYVRQSVMAVAGMIAVTAFLVIKPGDRPGTMNSLLDILPWFFCLSVAVVAAGRWTLAQRIRAIRNNVSESRA